MNARKAYPERQGCSILNAVATTVIVGASESGGPHDGVQHRRARSRAMSGSRHRVRNRRALPFTTDQYVCGKEKDAEDLVLSPDKGIRNAVVWLRISAARGKAETSRHRSSLDQKQCVFTPRVIVASRSAPPRSS